MNDTPKYILYREVVARVGAAAFKEEFVADLTWRELWILEATGLLGTAGALPVEHPQGPFASLPEFPAVHARLAYWEWQRDKIAEWLAERGIETFLRKGVDIVNRAQFEAAFARSFPNAANRNTSAPFSEDSLGAGRRFRHERKTKWDWVGAMAAYAAYLAKDADGLPEKQAVAERWVANWFVQTSGTGDAPPITEIRTRVVSPIYKASRAVGNATKK